MRANSAYIEGQSLTLEGEQAFAELYARLANWSREIADHQRVGNSDDAERLIDKSINLILAMRNYIDLDHHPMVSACIFALHRYAIRVLMQSKTEASAGPLDELDLVFIELSGAFESMRFQPSSKLGS